MGNIFDEVGGNHAGHIAVERLVLFEILSVVLQLLSIVFNGAIICTLCRRSLLKYPSNRFVFSLCLSHLVVSILSLTITLCTTLLTTFQNEPVYKNSLDVNHLLESSGVESSAVPVQCAGNSGVDLAHLIMMHINFGVAVCTSITVALISAERYITIARPMRYKSIVTARRSLCAIICCWFLTALITMMPLLLFENRDPVCGTYSVPMESLATYFGIVFAVVTVFALAVMIVCYSHIFRIAKAKCQKVQIGHFTASTVSSISSDWPSSVYSSAQGQHRFLHAGSRIESSNSLLHWVLLSNLGRHAQPLRMQNALRGGVPLTPPATPTLPPKNAFFSESALNNRRESDETTTTGTNSGNSSRNGSTSSSNTGCPAGHASNFFIDSSRTPFQYQHLPHQKLRNRWKTYLQPNYNSPRKTIFTIMLLIGAVLFTQLPLAFVLFTSTVEATQRWFQFCTTVLFSTSSVANPVLYGFLNRSIRDQLWRLLRRKSHSDHLPSATSIRKRKRGQQQLDEIAQNSKNILSPANHRHLQSICRNGVELPAIKISRKESISSEDNSVQSITSVNSMNAANINIPTTSSSAKAKINQVQKRITSSPYYRSVLMKKANNNKSLLPRLALPDVSIRRNSSGSVVNSDANGVIMSALKGKVKEMNEECNDPNDKKYGATSQNRMSVEMQTFRDYTTPELPLQSASLVSTLAAESESQNCKKIHSIFVVDDIESGSQNKSEGQDQLPLESDSSSGSGNDVKQDQESHQDSDCMPSASIRTNVVDDLEHDDAQPRPSSLSGSNELERSSNLETRDSVESVIGNVLNEDVLPDNFPRKPSQDSGADMTFSDEEDESPTIHVVNDQSSSPPLLLSTVPLSSLPMAMMQTRLVSRTDENSAATEHSSSSSLADQLYFVGHPDTSGNFRNVANPADVLLLPCSCLTKTENEGNRRSPGSIEHMSNMRNSNGVSVTITDSNSDTRLFRPELYNSDRNLLQVGNNRQSRQLTRAIKAHKSKSESDICIETGDTYANADIRIRSNCHINNLAVDKPNDHQNDAFTLNNCSQNNVEMGISPSTGSVMVKNGKLPIFPNSSQQSLFSGAISPTTIPSFQSQQWLSVMSVHSSCSSLSSTCPLRMLDEHNKSDVSDYDDFEDHIEI